MLVRDQKPVSSETSQPPAASVVSSSADAVAAIVDVLVPARVAVDLPREGSMLVSSRKRLGERGERAKEDDSAPSAA